MTDELAQNVPASSSADPIALPLKVARVAGVLALLAVVALGALVLLARPTPEPAPDPYTLPLLLAMALGALAWGVFVVFIAARFTAQPGFYAVAAVVAFQCVVVAAAEGLVLVTSYDEKWLFLPTAGIALATAVFIWPRRSAWTKWQARGSAGAAGSPSRA